MNSSPRLFCRLHPALLGATFALFSPVLASAQLAQPTPAADATATSTTTTTTTSTTIPVTTTSTTASSPTPQASSANQTIKLSPFEVQAEKDSGYYGANTLAGTRINSKIEDLGASITVVTKAQLDDTAALDINDIFKYEANTEGTSDYTAQLSNAQTNDAIQSSPQTAVRVRGLGVPNVSINNFSMTSRIPVDTYDLESVEISRGPNSTLFGLGQPAGTVNLNTLAANTSRDSNMVALRADSYGGWRTNIDFNRVLWKDKVAFRIAADDTENAFQRKPSYDRIKRLYLTTTIRPFPWTTIKLTWEHFMEDRQTPNYITPRDDVTEWIADGRPTWNPLTFTATAGNGTQTVVTQSGNENLLPGSTTNTLPIGLFANSTNYTRPSMYISNGQVELWEVNRLGTSNNPNAGSNSSVRMLQGSGSLIQRGDVNSGILYNIPGVNNKAIYDWTKYNTVSPDWNYDHATLYTTSIEQQLAPNLFIRGAWHLEDSNSYNRNIVNPPALGIDINQFLLDGRPNPYFRRPFYQATEPTIFQSPEYNDNLQAQLTYDLNMEDLVGKHNLLRFLGEHRILGYYESRHIEDGTYRYREAVLDPNAPWNVPPFVAAGTTINLTNGAAIARPTYRYYVGPPGAVGYTKNYTPPKSGVQGNFTFNYNLANGTFTTLNEPFGQAPYVASQTKQEVTSRGVVLQSLFLDDRIVFTGGIRNDFNRVRNSNGNVDNPVTGIYSQTPTTTWLPWTNAAGKTRTLSLVVKPLPWIGFFGDKSDSFVPQPPAIDLFNKVLPNTYGHGQDLGGYLSFFKDKLVVRASGYKNTVTNDRNADTTIGSRIFRLEFGGTGQGNDAFAINNWALNSEAAILGGLPLTDPRVVAAATALENYPAVTQATINSAIAGATLRGTNNTVAKGAELEIDYNPNANWNFKLTGAQTKSIQTSLEGDLTDYIALRMPAWLALNDGAGHFWWTDGRFTSQTPANFYSVSVSAPIQLDQALLGKSNPQVKEYTYRALSTYRFSEGPLKNFAIGGDIRWDSRSSIGYLGAAAGSDGVVRSLDITKAIYDPARYSGDLLAYYNMKMDHGRIGVRFQLNWQNVFQTGGLRVTAVNPDGSPYNFRIIDPQEWVLTTTFTF